jgi:signal peptidase II
MTMTTTEDVSRRSRRSLRLLLIAVAAAVVAADVTTKHVAATVWTDHPVRLLGGWIQFTESRNPGAAFGLGASATPLLAVIAVVAVTVIVALSGRCQTRLQAAILGLALGGAAGNLIDRLFRAPGVLRGHVVDWIDVGAWPTFNLADSSLVLACALLLLTTASSRATQDNPA